MNKTQLLRTDAVSNATPAGAAHLKLVETRERASSIFDWSAAEQLVERRIRRARGGIVVAPGHPFGGLVLVRVGSCKCSVTGSHGLEQITGYHIAGDLLCSEALCTGVHDSTVTAVTGMVLADAEVPAAVLDADDIVASVRESEP